MASSATLPPRASFELRERLVEDEIGRDHALRARSLQALGLAVELAGIRHEALEIGVGVLSGRDGVLLLEQARDLEEGAGVLRDHVGRVAPGPVRVQERDVAIRKLETLRSGLVGRAHDVDVDAGSLVERAGIDSLEARQALGDALRDAPAGRRPNGR